MYDGSPLAGDRVTAPFLLTDGGELDLLDCLRASDTSVSAAIAKQNKLSLKGLNLVQYLHVDARTPSVPDDITLLEVTEECERRKLCQVNRLLPRPPLQKPRQNTKPLPT